MRNDALLPRGKRLSRFLLSRPQKYALKLYRLYFRYVLDRPAKETMNKRLGAAAAAPYTSVDTSTPRCGKKIYARLERILLFRPR